MGWDGKCESQGGGLGRFLQVTRGGGDSHASAYPRRVLSYRLWAQSRQLPELRANVNVCADSVLLRRFRRRFFMSSLTRLLGCVFAILGNPWGAFVLPYSLLFVSPCLQAVRPPGFSMALLKAIILSCGPVRGFSGQFGGH
jgi:hypothetical protein